jgi:hypothetical protein
VGAVTETADVGAVTETADVGAVTETADVGVASRGWSAEASSPTNVRSSRSVVSRVVTMVASPVSRHAVVSCKSNIDVHVMSVNVEER